MQSSTDAESRGLRLAPLTPEHILSFKMSKENVREFAEVYKENPIHSLLEASKDPGTYAVLKGDEVLAITGIVNMRGEGLVWALFSQNMRKHFVRFARASEDLMEMHHQTYTTLVCDIWIQSTAIAQWLVFLGFEPEFEFQHNGQQMVRFVRCCAEVDYELPFGQRPVLH